MRVLQETTKWDTTKTGFNVPNHIYYVNDSKEKVHAFYSFTTGKITKLNNPIKFSTRYRTFKELKSK